MTRREPQSRDEGFLRRLHRRKLAARRGEELAEEPPGSVETRSIIDPAPEAEPDTVTLTDEDMPPVESLDADSDFSGFLSPGISEDLQRAALRRLWQVADMEFVDDLDIYASDYTQFEPLGELVTREMRHRLELEAIRQTEATLLHEEGENANAGPEGPPNPQISEGASVETESTDTLGIDPSALKPEKPA